MTALPTIHQDIIHKTRYARYNSKEGRRESWDETVTRFSDYTENRLKSHHGIVNHPMVDNVRKSILGLKVMPSMRALSHAGLSLDDNHLAAYNCAAIGMDSIKSFSEILYVSMHGTGMGYSVERKFTRHLPVVKPIWIEAQNPIIVEDSKEGWQNAFHEFISRLYEGVSSQVDYSLIRPAGSRLKTFGGYASGPGPLRDLFTFVEKKFKAAQRRQLTNLEISDINCMVGNCVVSGGVRRTALLCLCDLEDAAMMTAKTGNWRATHPYRAFCNISTAYDVKPTEAQFDIEWQNLMDSGSGERGVYNREGAKKQAQKYGRDPNHYFLPNPCGEIILRSRQMCNLTEVVARPYDTRTTLLEKIEIATFIGTFQSTLTDFYNVDSKWKSNCEEERLLGVSITGIMDCPLLYKKDEENAKLLREMRDHAIEANAHYAKEMGINASASVSTVKPSGTVSLLADSAPGIHPRFANKYLRRITQAPRDPMTDFMKEKKIPYEVSDMRDQDGNEIPLEDRNVLFKFPMEAPGSLTVGSLSALEFLETWMTFKENFTTHNPSITVSVEPHEWMPVKKFVYDNFDDVLGISFLPKFNSLYTQMPYEVIPDDEFQELKASIPTVDFSEFKEIRDTTTSGKEVACSAGACEI